MTLTGSIIIVTQDITYQTKQLQQKYHTTKQEQTTKSNQNTQHLFLPIF